MFLPRWYPNNEDIQLGIFFQEQVKLISDKFLITVIYVQNDERLNSKYKIELNNQKGFDEYTVYFKKHSLLKKYSHLSRYFKAQKMAFKQIAKEIDIVHVHVPIRPTLLALYLKRKLNIPFVISEHWSGHLTGEFNNKNILYKFIYKYVLSKASKISTVSAFLNSSFKKNTGFKSVIIPNFIQKNTVINQVPVTDYIDILSISDFNNRTKNITGLLKAFNKAFNKNDTLRLTIVGDGPDRKEIEQVIINLKIPQENLILLGRLSHDQVLIQIPKCNFYISNSNFETFGMSIAEALFYGKPVISTKSGGPNEFVNENNGILINKNQETELLNAILKMSEGFESYNQKEIQDEIERKYGRIKVLEDWVEFYNTI